MNLDQKVNIHSITHGAMINYGFLPKFPPTVIREVNSLKAVDFSSLKDVSDMTHYLWSSIDNEDSRDLDQIEYCERFDDGRIHVWVAIADVDEYVPKDSHADQHAAYNGTSVYTGVQIFPMLPERLSTNLSSLNENQERLAVVIDFVVENNGEIQFGSVQRAVVKNHAKLIYEQIGDWLEEKGAKPTKLDQIKGLEDQIRWQDEAALRMKTFRQENGALQLETIEPRPIVKNGKVVDLVVQEKNRARYLIENFMIAANKTMVNFLEKNGKSYIQRVLRNPERWPRIRELAESYGWSLPSHPDPKRLSDFLSERQIVDPERFPDLSLAVVKLIGSAEYVFAHPGDDVDIGHFGLAVYDYTHSTAPNRRYIDVIIQRLIKAIIKKSESPYTDEEIEETAIWCTERTHCAKKVERFMRKVAGAVLLSHRLNDVFEAIVTGASEKGTYVRLMKPPVEGRVVRGGGNLDVGQKIKVRLVALDPESGHIDFSRSGKKISRVPCRK